MGDFNLALAIAAATVLLLRLVGNWVKFSFWGSEALVCLVVGLAIGPVGFELFPFAIFDNKVHADFLEQFARLTLALSVMSAAIGLPAGYFRRNWRSMALVLLPGMALMWACSTGLVLLMLPLPPLMALLIGAIVTPTDPVLARSVVAGGLAERNVDASTRASLIAESGANDGLALPAVMLPIMLMKGGDVAVPFATYAVREIGGAVVIGWLLGKGAGILHDAAAEKESVAPGEPTALILMLALLAVSVAHLAGADGILAVFVAGIVFRRAQPDESADTRSSMREVVDRALVLPVFIMLGVAAPVHLWLAGGWLMLATAVMIVLLRRIPGWLLLQAVGRPYDTWREALFAGWFGPVGVAALFYAVFALKESAPPVVWALASLAVVISVVVHGVLATPFTRKHGTWREKSRR